jgi:hypothetical protein
MPKVGGKPHSLTLEGFLIPLLCGHAVRFSDIPRGFMCVTSSMVLRCTNVGHSVHLSSWSSAVDYPSSGFKMHALRIPFHRLAACVQMVKNENPDPWRTIRPGNSTYEGFTAAKLLHISKLYKRAKMYNKKTTRIFFTLRPLIINELRVLKILPKPRVAGSSPVYRSRVKWLETSNIRC